MTEEQAQTLQALIAASYVDRIEARTVAAIFVALLITVYLCGVMMIMIQVYSR